MLTSQDTTLRQPDVCDFDFLVRLRNDAIVQAQLMALMRANSVRRVENWIEAVLADPDSLFFIISETQSGKGIGFIQLRRIDFVHRHGNLGIALTAEFRGKGHGFNAIKLLENHAADVFGVRKAMLQVLADNQAAVRLYSKCGYRTVGTMTSHFYHTGTFHDVILMEHLLARNGT